MPVNMNKALTNCKGMCHDSGHEECKRRKCFGSSHPTRVGSSQGIGRVRQPAAILMVARMYHPYDKEREPPLSHLRRSMNICVTCRHCDTSDNRYECAHPNLPGGRSLVTGMTTRESCWEVRDLHTACGPHGVWWEPQLSTARWIWKVLRA